MTLMFPQHYRYPPLFIERLYAAFSEAQSYLCMRNKDSNVDYQTMKSSTANSSSI